jgi:hypothetical protein
MGPAHNVGAADPDSAEPEATAIEHATTFRETFGFPSDRSFVEQAESDPNYSSELYGVPLSNAEIAEMQRRIGVERAAQPAVDLASKQPHWAGWYIDQRDQGTPVFLFASGGGELGAEIADLMPETRFRVERAERTWEELLETQRQIDQATDRLIASGIDLTMTGIDIRANRVDVGVDGLTADDKAVLTKEFGEGLPFRDEAPAVSDACTGATGTLNCRPIKGGLRMNNSVGGNGCTSGFIVRRSANGAQLAVLTAGHCIAGHPVNTDWNHNGSRFGESKYHTWGRRVPPMSVSLESMLVSCRRTPTGSGCTALPPAADTTSPTRRQISIRRPESKPAPMEAIATMRGAVKLVPT